MKCERMVLLVTVMLLTFCQVSYTQEHPTLASQIVALQSKFSQNIQKETDRLSVRITQSSTRSIKKVKREEARLLRRLKAIGSIPFGDSAAYRHTVLVDNITGLSVDSNPVVVNYVGAIDSARTALSFLHEQGILSGQSGLHDQKIVAALASIQRLELSLHQSFAVKDFIAGQKAIVRRLFTTDEYLPAAVKKYYKALNKQLLYYRCQIAEYQALLNNPEQLQRKMLALLNKVPAFQEFMRRHSELARLFAVPDNSGAMPDLAGLQERSQVQELLQARFALPGPNPAQMMQRQVQAGTTQLNDLKERLAKLGVGEEELDMPNYKPANTRTKTFFKQLEYGTNIQTVKSGNFYPSTTDIGLSIGYKIGKTSIAGIGGSYKIGWSKSFRNIDITSQGASVRSFADLKLKGSFYVSAGFEYNYQPISYGQNLSRQELSAVENWQESGLIGISKIVSLKYKWLKKAKLQLLWDFLSYQQIPNNQSIKFRVGYHF